MEEQKQKTNPNEPVKKAPAAKKLQVSCDDCLYFEQDDETGIAECQLNLDQDEMAAYLHRRSRDCPYFRMHDEYKTVQKQI